MEQHDSTAMTNTMADLECEAHTAAYVYLRQGSAPRRELVRVLAAHLQVSLQTTDAVLQQLVDNGRVTQTGSETMSLPAGGDTRDTKENQG